MSSSWQQSARERHSRKWSRTWVLNCYWQSFSSCRPTLRLLKPTVVILCFTGVQFDFDERFLIECFFFLHLCFCWQGKENKSVGKSCLSFFLGFLLSLFDSRSYISPVERKEKRERDKRRNDIILPTWGPYTVELSGSHDRFSLFFLFFLAAYILLCLKSSLSCRFRRWLDPSGLEWWSTGYMEGECAPLQGRRLLAWEGGLITLHAHSLSSLVIRFFFFPSFSFPLSLPSLSLSLRLSPPLCLFPIGWRGGWQRPARQPMPSRHDGCEIPTERSGAFRSRGFALLF